jgi:hypothetical protein
MAPWYPGLDGLSSEGWRIFGSTKKAALGRPFSAYVDQVYAASRRHSDGGAVSMQSRVAALTMRVGGWGKLLAHQAIIK